MCVCVCVCVYVCPFEKGSVVKCTVLFTYHRLFAVGVHSISCRCGTDVIITDDDMAQVPNPQPLSTPFSRKSRSAWLFDMQ